MGSDGSYQGDLGHPRGRVVCVAGPTASGKSALALDIARAFAGTVINADSMQVYAGLSILTARPSAADEAAAPHVLYGTVDPATAYSAADWRAAAVREIETAWDAGRLPIVVGGTGLYFRALIEGFSPIPAIPEAVRARVRARFRDLGPEAFAAALAERDPGMAGRLHPSDSQRLMRAMEVIEATGRSLADWQAEPASGPGVDAAFFKLLISPPRPALHAAIEGRFDRMVEAGALDEVRALVARGLDPTLPAMKALGVPEFSAHLDGATSLERAIADAKTATRRYAKRQCTWFRNQMQFDQVLDAQYSESLREEVFSKVRRFLLTPLA